MKQTVTVYGPGGFDPNLPNGNVVETYEVEVPDPIPTPEERLDALAERLANANTLAEVRAAAREAKRPEPPEPPAPVEPPTGPDRSP